MLSRTASNVYWMARYFERAESTARLLGACFQPGLPFDGNIKRLYELPLDTQGALEDYQAKHGDVIDVEKVCNFLIKGDSAGSIRNCLLSARENARSERSRLSTEVWESINQTWLEFHDMQNKSLITFTDWLKQRIFVFQGTINTTMPSSLTRYFIRLGTFTERADQTLRVLEAKGVLRELSNQSDYYHWHMLLRSTSSYEAYQESVIGDSPTKDSVFEFLVYHKSLPRSVRYCIEKVEYLLNAIGSQDNQTPLKVASQILVKLKYDNMDDIIDIGQDEYVKTLQKEVLLLGSKIHSGYFKTA